MGSTTVNHIFFSVPARDRASPMIYKLYFYVRIARPP